MSESLQTQRLFLKKITPQFVHEQFETKTAAAIQSYFNLDDAGFELLQAMHEKGMETNRISMLYFLLIEKESGIAIGDCGYHTWNAAHRRAEVFYSLRNDQFKRKGFLSEVLPLVIKYGFEKMKLHRIAGLVSRSNEPSLRLLQKQGFRFEGTLREDFVVNNVSEDSECYSLLLHEWQAANEAH